MLSVQDPEILSLVPDYRINLFSPAEIKDEELNKLQSNLREVMLFIKYAKDKRKLKELTSENSSFQSLELKAARVIDSITGINLRFTETERSVNMCQAVQEMCDDARAEGHAQGLQDQALLTAQRMLQDPRFSPEDISKYSGLPLTEILKLQKKIVSINLRFTEAERSINMCQAVQEMCDDARAEGHASGLSEGHAQGLQDQALLTAQRMLQDSRFSPEDISRFSGLPLEDVLKLREK